MDDLTIWREFVALLLSDRLEADMLCPYVPDQETSLLDILHDLRGHVTGGWGNEPECFSSGSGPVFLTKLYIGEQCRQFCFTFSLSKDGWRLRHVESIMLRLDRLATPPTSDFPDLPSEQKDWIREELAMSEQVRLYRQLKADRGREYALRWFCDGAGYALAARSWVPFVPPERAFLLYLCWEQARLRGSKVSLESLSDDEARVRLVPLCFSIYRAASHLRTQIAQEELDALFEAVWQDRAHSAGWDLTFSHAGDARVFHFARLVASGQGQHGVVHHRRKQ